jgi:hypothetical protein
MKKVIPYEVCLREGSSFGVQTFKYEVGVVVPVEDDADQDQLAHDNLFQLFEVWNLIRPDLALEKLVGAGDLVARRGEFIFYDSQKRLPVSLRGEQLESVIALLKWVLEQGLLNLVCKRAARRGSRLVPQYR